MKQSFNESNSKYHILYNVAFASICYILFTFIKQYIVFVCILRVVGVLVDYNFSN
jgi:hypothetical protein